MAQKTKIEWTDFNWNFLRGCSRVSEGCGSARGGGCYAEAIAARFSGEGQTYEGLAKMVNGKPRWTGEIGFYEDILLKPLRWKKPRRVFVNSMSDLFHEKVKDEWLDKAFAVMALTPHITYQILTKRPKRMLEYLGFGETAYRVAYRMGVIAGDIFTGSLEKAVEGRGVTVAMVADRFHLPNVWLGVSVEDQKTANERIPILIDTPASLRWLSVEPLLGPIDLTNIKFPNSNGVIEDWNVLDRLVMSNGINDQSIIGVDDPIIDWVVVGGESGRAARLCDISWISSIIQQCQAASPSVPVFVKQLGSQPVKPFYYPDCGNARVSLKDGKGGEMSEWPADLRIREFPEVVKA